MNDSETRHLVGVWNPSYGVDVMESHILVLRGMVEQFRQSGGDEEDVYVWWGKIRSSRRQTALPHIADILSFEKELGEQDGDAQREVQLYLTDYRSLYVAHIAEITADDIREDEDDQEAAQHSTASTVESAQRSVSCASTASARKTGRGSIRERACSSRRPRSSFAITVTMSRSISHRF